MYRRFKAIMKALSYKIHSLLLLVIAFRLLVEKTYCFPSVLFGLFDFDHYCFRLFLIIILDRIYVSKFWITEKNIEKNYTIVV